MVSPEANKYLFHCKVVEVISTGGERRINAMCDPGSFIMEVPDDGQIQLGDTLTISGSIQIESIEQNSIQKSNHESI
jgi:hypothetical protein